MLSQYLYSLCNFITSSFNYPVLDHTIEHSSFINLDIYENIMVQNYFHHIWLTKLHHSFSNFRFSYKYKILEQYNDLIKIKLSIQKSFFINSSDKKIKSASIDDYLVITECSKASFFNTLLLISRECDEPYYDRYAGNSLSSLSDADYKTVLSASLISWKDKIKNINELYDNFISLTHNPYFDRSPSSKFNIEKACSYAEMFALTPNNDYKDFNDSGGDCTNFISQVLHAGGIPFTAVWRPYTHSWLRVEELYNYVINNVLGKKLPVTSLYKRGSVIQFYTPQKGHYFHSGFITYVLPYNEALYCCHSYNKLNYPLSEIYPVIYPVIRCITLY